ncbi:MAG TPA: hypothetical protein VIL46_02130 [Gemmataceae bacterium]
MSLWLRARRAPAAAAAVLLTAAALAAVKERLVPVPNLLGNPQLDIPLAVFVPLPAVTVLARGLTAGDPLVEAVAGRPLPLLDAVLALAAATAALGVDAAAWAAGASPLALAAGRNTLGYVGLMLLGRRLLGSEAAGLLPVGFVILTTLFGAGPGRRPLWWAWPLEAAGTARAWALAGALLALGLALTVRGRDARGR